MKPFSRRYRDLLRCGRSLHADARGNFNSIKFHIIRLLQSVIQKVLMGFCLSKLKFSPMAMQGLSVSPSVDWLDFLLDQVEFCGPGASTIRLKLCHPVYRATSIRYAFQRKNIQRSAIDVSKTRCTKNRLFAPSQQRKIYLFLSSADDWSPFYQGPKSSAC